MSYTPTLKAAEKPIFERSSYAQVASYSLPDSSQQALDAAVTETKLGTGIRFYHATEGNEVFD
jgi:hypothetical protein